MGSKVIRLLGNQRAFLIKLENIQCRWYKRKLLG